MNRETNILVVENIRSQAGMIGDILKKDNYRVFRAEDGNKALKMLKERRFSVILSATVMPGLNGYAFCRKVKNNPSTKDIPLLLLTALSDPGDIIAGLECGADNFIVKPFEPDFLRFWIKHHLGGMELHKAGGGREGLEFFFEGHKHFLSSDKVQILSILLSIYEAAVRKNRELKKAQGELELINSTLEKKVEERMADLRREIQTRIKSEENMRGAVQREKMVLRTLPLAFFYGKPEKDGLHIEWVSEGAEILCGCKPEEFINTRDLWLSRMHPEDKERVLSDIVRLREEGAISTEYRWLATGGKYRWVLASATITDGYVLCLWLDISERKALELQFRQAQKMEAVGRLAGGIAHDFNNLLTAINGYAGFLLKSLAPDDERRSDVGEIIKAAEGAASLTRQLMTFSRRQIFQLKVLDCNVAIRDTEKMLRRLIGENVSLSLDLAKEESRIKTAPGQLEQIIINLVVNARDAMPKGGKMIIKTENVELGEIYSRMHMEVRPGPYTVISVTDTGCGMDSELISHIFEPFFTTKEAGKGTGLGLATVYGIVRQCGGNIFVYSEPGHGATFKIYLPRVMEKAEAAILPVVQKELRGSETILLVEDDDGMRGFVLRVLLANGYTVIEARNAEEAVKLCEDNAARINLILTDNIMPGMSGSELYGILSRRCPDVKAILMSGYADTKPDSVGCETKQLPFIQKPFSADDLAGKVREVLDPPQSARF
jgi:DNA-binding response OmpR family regulator/nitrogen-specific signal transduction histidine kinase